MRFDRADWENRKAKWDFDTLPYAAGFLDGEGCFSVGQHWKITITCANTNLAVIQWLQSQFGGTITKPRHPRKPTHRPVWAWQITGHGADAVCKHIAPYLKEKREQALLLIAIQQTMGLPLKGRKVDPEVAAERDRLAAMVKESKRRAA